MVRIPPYYFHQWVGLVEEEIHREVGDKQNNTFLLTKFTSIQKNENEIASEFNNCFTKLIQGFIYLYTLAMKLL